MRTATAFPPALLLLAAAAARAAEEPQHPAIESAGEKVMEFRGSVEAGLRFVRGEEGRYAQDVRLGDGLRLLDLDVEGTALGEGRSVDEVRLRAHGLGDPDSRASLRAHRKDAWDLDLHWSRLEYAHLATAEPHPFETVRTTEGMRLRFRPRERVEVAISTEHVARAGDATLSQGYQWRNGDLDLLLPATVDYDGRFHSLSIDASPGRFRFGATASASRQSDATFRLLDHPDTPVDDVGPFRRDADTATRTLAVRAGARLLGGKADLSASASWTAAGTDATVHEDVTTITTGPDGRFHTFDDGSQQQATRGRTSVDLAARRWRAEALLLPHPSWEILLRHEEAETDEDGFGDLETEVDHGGFVPLWKESSAEATLRRDAAEARWRASRRLRLRAGVERVREDVSAWDNENRSWSPRTRILTAGTDWNPSERFDASLLWRAAAQRSPATQLSPGDARGLSLRMRTRHPSGWHATGFARTKERAVSRADSEGRVGAYGVTGGWSDAVGFAEASVERRSYAFAGDTRLVFINAAGVGVTLPGRVRYAEQVTSVALDFSRTLSGPLRVFSRTSAARGGGAEPYEQVDAALGLGWRLRPQTELRLEERRAVFRELRRARDDYRADVITLSFVYEF